MRGFAWVFVVLGLAASAEAQEPSSKWDFGVTAGLFEGRPNETDTSYGDDWYSQGRYAASIGRYWTEHLKTEIEYAQTGEGSRYINESVTLGGRVYPVATTQFYRLRQGTGRVVWQFLENSWVHPYVSAGVVVEEERRRHHVPPQYQWPVDPRTNQPVVVRSEFDSGTLTDYRAGGSVGAGSKFYVSPNAYINAGIVASYAKPSTTVTFLAGFGIDF